jgi:hypothetical protein
MKRRILPIMLCIMFISSIWIANAYADPPSYPIICKGGGNMTGLFNTDAKDIVINFEKSPQAGSRQEPAPGTCAWVDRPINAQEASPLKYTYENTGMSFDFRYKNMTLNLGSRDNALKYLWDAVYNGKVFYVRCYKNNYGYLTITHVGP